VFVDKLLNVLLYAQGVVGGAEALGGDAVLVTQELVEVPLQSCSSV
jgi:hypothetical protein